MGSCDCLHVEPRNSSFNTAIEEIRRYSLLLQMDVKLTPSLYYVSCHIVKILDDSRSVSELWNTAAPYKMILFLKNDGVFTVSVSVLL